MNENIAKTLSAQCMEKLQGLMEEKDLSGLLFLYTARDEMLTWLTGARGFRSSMPNNRPASCAVTRDGRVFLIESSAVFETEPVVHTDPDMPAMPGHPNCVSFPGFYYGSLEPVFAGRVGLINPMEMKKNVRDHLKRHFPDAEYVDVSYEVACLKAAKSEDEAELCRKGAAIYDRLFSAMPLVLRPGRLEKEAAVDIRMKLLDMGVESDDLGTFTTLTLTSSPDAGAAVPEPIKYPGVRMEYGSRVELCVHGFVPDGTAAAMGRCFVLGEASDETRKYCDLAVKAQDLAASLIKPGVTLREAAKEVNRRCIVPAGVPADTSCWIFGIGCGRCEFPMNIGVSADMPVPEGAVLVIAPHICPAGRDPYCCMDMFRVTKTGCERLSEFPRELIELA